MLEEQLLAEKSRLEEIIKTTDNMAERMIANVNLININNQIYELPYHPVSNKAISDFIIKQTISD